MLGQSGSVTDAAERVRLRQPSVSSALKRLEDRIGRRLIDRSPGQFELTEAGRLLYQEALDIQRSILHLGTVLGDMTDIIRGHVTIAMASHVVSPLLDDTLRRFHETHPEATFSIDVSTSEEALNKIRAGRASCAICLVRNRHQKLEYARLYREFFGLFCGPSHPLFGRTDLTPTDLSGRASVSFVTDRLEDALRPVTLMRAAADMEDRVVGTSAHLEEVRRMIVAGLGIGPLPIHVVKRDLQEGILWQVPPYVDLPAIDVHVAWNPASRMNPAERVFLELLQDQIACTPMEERTYR